MTDAEQVALLRRLIEVQGFKIIDGDFTYRDGSRGPFYVKPIDPERLIRNALRALLDPEHV